MWTLNLATTVESLFVQGCSELAKLFQQSLASVRLSFNILNQTGQLGGYLAKENLAEPALEGFDAQKRTGHTSPYPLRQNLVSSMF